VRKPRSYDDYAAVDGEILRSSCLTLASALSDLMRTELTIVGGYVPSLLVPQEELPRPQKHCGTIDIDVALSMALLDAGNYEIVEERLWGSGFRPDVNRDGNATRQKWCVPGGASRVTIDFLIPPTRGGKPGGLQNLTGDLAAITMPGLQLVGRDWVTVRLSGRTLEGAALTREVRVCGPGAFIVLKARAIRNRDEPKDAFDIDYVLRQLAGGVPAVAKAIRALLDDNDASEAIEWLDEDYASIDSIGPMRLAQFQSGDPDDEAQADAWALVRDLLRRLGR
jgi:hypothetical protein